MHRLRLLQIIRPCTPVPNLLETFSNNRFCPIVCMEWKTGRLYVCHFSCEITMTTRLFLNPFLKHSRSFSMQKRFALAGWKSGIIYPSVGKETHVQRS